MLDKAVMRLSGVYQLLRLLAGLDILQAIFIIGQAVGLSRAITGIWEGRALESQLLPVASFFACYLGRHLINYLKDERLDRFASQQASQLRGQLLRKLFELGPHIVQKEGSGNMITMTLDGISLVENYLHLILNKMMNMSIIPWVILVFIFYLDWKSGLVLLIVFPIIILFMIILGYAAQARANRQYAQYQLLSNHFLDTLRGLDTLKFFGRSKSYAQTIYQTSEHFRKATMNALRIGILSTFALDFFTTLSIAVVAVLLGLRLINGQMLLFPALTILILAPEYFLPVRDFSSDYHATLDGKNAMQSMQQILNTPSIRKEQVSIAPWTHDSCLELDRISIAYEGKKLFGDTSLTFSGYQKIGIIGMSGSGKSSLINLLGGFLAPEEGKIRIDGLQMANLDQEDWRKQLLYIPQHPYIFEMSLRDNITFYTPSASDAEVQEAIAVVGLDELVAHLPEGLDTRIGNGARPLSGGQAQRIALARAFLDKERRVLLLDEPTAHLDIETELELKEKMLPLMDNRLVLIATHRLHWLHQMDYILVVDQGQIVEMGSYEELLSNKGTFYHLKTAMGGNHD